MDDLETLLKTTFLDEAVQMLSSCEQSFLQLETSPNDMAVIDQIFRVAHSFKGSAGVAGFEDLATLAHHLESLLVKLKKDQHKANATTIDLLLRANDELNHMVSVLKSDRDQRFDNSQLIAALAAHASALASGQATPADGGDKTKKSASSGFHDFADERDEACVGAFTLQMDAKNPQASPAAAAPADENIRVNLNKIDHLVNDVGELVILQTVLYQHRHTIPSVFLQKTISQLDKIVRKIQGSSMGLRMVPIKQTFQKMQRIVRDAAQSLQKDMLLKTMGEDTQIDKTILDLLADPLVHLIRNAADHGIELPAVREAAGKPRVGSIKLSAYHRGDNIIVEVADDGGGLNREKILAKAVQAGLVSPDQNLSDREVYQLIFKSGFSTAAQVTSISGRGVGMDVVKTNIDQMQGNIEIDSTLQMGTCFRIVLPLTLAIVDGMVVTVDDQRFVIPVAAISESIRPAEGDITYVTGRGLFLKVRDETIQLCQLAQMLGRRVKDDRQASGIAIMGKNKTGKKFSILVDDILGQQQIVIKRLGHELRGLPGITGAAILGDGKATLIVDPADLFTAYSARRIKPLARKDAV